MQACRACFPGVAFGSFDLNVGERGLGRGLIDGKHEVRKNKERREEEETGKWRGGGGKGREGKGMAR